MKERILQGVIIDCTLGNIADQPDMDVIVNAANADLRIGGGVAGAIHRAAGPGLEAECRPFAPIQPGDAVITRAHGLSNRYVIHCLGPVFARDWPAAILLASCYRNALRLAEEKEVESIAFPAISTGAFGYPMKEAAQVAFTAIQAMLPQLSSVKQIRFVLHDEPSRRLHESILDRLIGIAPPHNRRTYE